MAGGPGPGMSEMQNIEKQIKRHVYGKPQSALACFPAGLGAAAMEEIESILDHLWFEQKFNGRCTLLKNEIRIENIHFFALSELLMRSLCLSDLRLILFEGKSAGKEAFAAHCRAIRWEYYLDASMILKIKVDSVASKAFHEGGLKEILTNILKLKNIAVVSGENTAETTCLYAGLYKDKLTVSLSLAGNPLYKRGYRGALGASAPLREDAAACAIRNAFHFSKKHKENLPINTLWVPFSGTGTFVFEYLHYQYQHSPCLLNREYALQKMPLFRKEAFAFLLKKARENSRLVSRIAPENRLNILCVDTSARANAAFMENIENFKKTFDRDNFDFIKNAFVGNSKGKEPVFREDFLKLNLGDISDSPEKKWGNVFLPLNPPYGIRLNDKADSRVFYSNVGKKVFELAIRLNNENHHLLGFILCPDEESWSAFGNRMRGAELETYHFTQGGMDIRACQFFK